MGDRVLASRNLNSIKAFPPWDIEDEQQSRAGAQIWKVIPDQRKCMDLCNGQEGPARQLRSARRVSGNRPF